MAKANIADVEGVYEDIIQDEDFVREVSRRDAPYEYMKRDSHIYSTWQSRTIPVASAPWRVTSTSAPQAKKLTEQLKCFPEFQRFRMVIMDAIFRGYAGVELEFNPPGSPCIIRDFIPIKADAITFTPDGEPRLLTQSHPYEGESMPFPQFVVVSWGERFHGRRRGMGLGQKVWWPYFMKSAGLKFWATAVERFGMPGIKAMVLSRGDIKARRTRWKEILRDYTGGTGIVYEDGEEIDLLQVNQPGTSYRVFMEFLNSEISKAIVGQTLTTEQGSRGAFSLGKVHAAVRDDIMWADTKWVDEMVTRWLLPIFGALIYGDKYKPATFESIWEDPEESIRNADRLKALGEIKLPLRKMDVYSAAGFPEPKPGDDIFKWPEAPVMNDGGRPFGTGKPLDKPRKSPDDGFSEESRVNAERKDQDDLDTLALADLVKTVSNFTLEPLKGRLKKKR